MKSKDAYIEQLSTELKSVSAQIDILGEKFNTAAADMKNKYGEELESLNAQKHAMAEKIQELQDDTSDAWESVKETTDKLWTDLKTGVNNALAKFQ